MKALLLTLSAALLFSGCGRPPSSPASGPPPKHEHHPPHGGTPVVLGDEVYHLELVRDPEAGTLSAYVLDGEMEEFVRSAMPAFEIDATAGGKARLLRLVAIPDPATGETVGDTSLFQARADWLRTIGDFDGIIPSITIRGSVFREVKFNFPRGNDTD